MKPIRIFDAEPSYPYQEATTTAEIARSGSLGAAAQLDLATDPDRGLRGLERGGARVVASCREKFPYDFLIVGSKSSRNAATSILFEREDLRMAGRTRIFYGPRERTAALDQAYKWSSKAPFHLTGSK